MSYLISQKGNYLLPPPPPPDLPPPPPPYDPPPDDLMLPPLLFIERDGLGEYDLVELLLVLL
ncbi:hypothetical protein D3C85_1914560 [compost metagenome]